MASPFPSADKGQVKLFAILFGSLVLLLGLGYYFFLRTDHAVLYTGLRPAEASAVVAELKEQAVDYRLRDDGTTILVPVDEAAAVRLAIAGSDVSSKGMVGFELFNKSDMGLTDFAQKINYQRALQGELSRTIMMMDGVENARVHLALPERSLFRGNRSEPKAAVTVVGRRGTTLSEARVAGIQRLVAAAVPDLALSEVVVLDEIGRVISKSLEIDPLLAPEAEEQAAVQQYYRARIRSAVGNVLRGQKFEVRLLVVPLSPDSGAEPAKASAAASRRDFQLRIAIVTQAGLNPEDQVLVRDAVAGAVKLDEQVGDSLTFDVQPLLAASYVPAEPAAEPVIAEPTQSARPEDSPAADLLASIWAQNWWVALLALLGLLIMFGRRAGASELSTEERDEFVERIRRQLEAEGKDARV
jgi:flagellar M-ring protein FliF